MRRLLLWDVDGTLVRGGGVGADAMMRAVAAVCSAEVDGSRVMMHGKTDQQIFDEIFRGAGLSDEEITALLPLAMAEAERVMAQSESELRARGHVIEGVTAVLRRMHETIGVRQTLVTGNLVGNARVKLAAFELAAYFDTEVGAYGTDHFDRNALVPIALERVERLRRERYDAADVWVIGDTPRDLMCARAAGVRCLLVATGQIPMSELDDLGADAVRPDLTDTEAVVELLTGG